MDQHFLQAFAEVIREQLARKQEVVIDRLGVFECSHQKQFQQQYDNGKVVMMPPEDRIIFSAEKSSKHAD